MKRSYVIVMFAWVWVPLLAYAGAPGERSQRVEAGTVSFSTRDHGDGTHWWHRENKDFRIESVQLQSDGYILKYLFLTEQVIETHIGIENAPSRLKVTAYRITESTVSDALWTFDADGHAWKLVDKRIEVTNYGCCDVPDTKAYFSVAEGRIE